MKLYANGPDIPFELVKALDNDKLIFFCGAGVSKCIANPSFGGFKELLSEVKQKLSIKEPLPEEPETAFEKLLQLTKDKTLVDDSIRRILTLQPETSENLKQHQAILRLSKSLTRPIPRLVTTNFDNCFEVAWKALKQDELITHSANALPVPDGNWKSTVYLHGQASEQNSELIYSSSSFAKAYLWNQWAANFLRLLFQNYTVVFAGYSMNDPIMTYVVQAIHSDERPYIFIHENEQEVVTKYGLKAIPYKIHKALWKSLEHWANLHEQGKDGWISYAQSELFGACPTGVEWSSEGTTAVQNLTQILSTPSHSRGLTKLLPEVWLETFIKINNEMNLKEQYFNVLQPTDLHPKIANKYKEFQPLHPVTQDIGFWMATHMKDPAILKYIVENGSIIHSNLIYDFRDNFKEFSKEMETPLKQAWEIVLFHASPVPTLAWDTPDFKKLDLTDKFIQDSFKQRLLKYLQPRLALKPPTKWLHEHDDKSQLSHYLDFNLVLSCGYCSDLFEEHSILLKLEKEHPEVLVNLINTLESHVLELTRLNSLFREESILSLEWNLYTRSRFELNNEGIDWILLLDWLQACFKQLSPDEQEQRIQLWSNSNSLLLQRLALKGYIHLKQYMPYLNKLIINNKNSLLFESTALADVEELFLFLRNKSPKTNLKKLKYFIKNAPDSETRKTRISAHTKEHFLELLECKTEPYGHERYKIESGWVGPLMPDSEFEKLSNHNIIKQLNEKAGKYSRGRGLTDVTQNWEVFAPSFPERAWVILQSSKLKNKSDLFEKMAWGLIRYEQNEKSIYQTQWDCLSCKNGYIDTYISQELNPKPLIEWLNTIANRLELPDKIYLKYWFRLWTISFNKPISTSIFSSGGVEKQSDYLSEAINDPRGKLAEGLIGAIYRHKPEFNDLIPPQFQEALESIFNTNTEEVWLAQLIFAGHYRNFFIIDPEWTINHLLPAFSYQVSKERAARLWTGLLYNPNLSIDSFISLKAELLGLINVWDQLFSSDMNHLSELRRNYTRMIVFWKLLYPELITDQEFQLFFNELNGNDLKGLFKIFEDLSTEPIEKGQDLIFWEKTLQPFFEDFWDGTKKSPQISLAFFEFAALFPNAMVSIKDYLLAKPFLTKASFQHNRIIYPLSKGDFSRIKAPFHSLDNAKAFFDLFIKILEPIEGQQAEYSLGLHGLSQMLDKFIETYPEISNYPNFISIKRTL